MTRLLGFEIPFAPDSRYPTLFVGGRVTKLPPCKPKLSGKVIRYEFGAGRPWVVEWDRDVTFDSPDKVAMMMLRNMGDVPVIRIHCHLGEELQHQHTCIACERGENQVHTHECTCGRQAEDFGR